MKGRGKYIILLSVLAVLILIWIASYFYQPKTYDLPNLKQVKNVTKIELKKIPGGSSTLVLTNGRWLLEPGDYYADKTAVSDMISQLATFSISDLVSGGSLLSYGLDDSNRIEISAYDGNNMVLRFFMGKTSTTFRHTYVEIPGDSNVYQAKGTFTYSFSRDQDSLKSKEISTLNKDDIRELKISENGAEYVIDKIKTAVTNNNPSTNVSKIPVDSGEAWKGSWKKPLLNSGKVDALLQKLTPMTAAGVSSLKIDNKSRFLRSFVLKTDKDTVVINIIMKENSKDKFYLLSVEGNTTLFKISESLGKDLLKSVNEL